MACVEDTVYAIRGPAATQARYCIHNNLVSRALFPGLGGGAGKDIFVWTGKNDSKMERVEASYFSKSGSVDGPCIPTDFDAQYLS